MICMEVSRYFTYHRIFPNATQLLDPKMASITADDMVLSIGNKATPPPKH